MLRLWGEMDYRLLVEMTTRRRVRRRGTKRVRGAGCGASCTVEQRIAKLQDDKMGIEIQQRINKKNLATAETAVKILVASNKPNSDIRPKATEIITLKNAIIQQEKAKAAIDAMIGTLKSSAGKAALAKGVKNATRALASGPSAYAIKGQMNKFEKASAGVKAAEKAIINGSASAAGVSGLEVEATIKRLKNEEEKRLREGLSEVPTGPVVIGGRLKSRRRK